MLTLDFVTLLAVFSLASSDSIVFDVFNGNNKLCANDHCTFTSNQKLTIKVKWTFTGANRVNPRMQLIHDNNVLQLKDRINYFHVCRNSQGLFTQKNACTLTLTPNTYTFNLPQQTAANTRVDITGTLYVNPDLTTTSHNTVTVKKA